MKTILAWLDWSTYCMNRYYEFPSNLCSLFWRTLFAIAIIPLLWPGHLWNVFLTRYNFKAERYSDNKMFIWVAGLLHLLAILFSLIADSILESMGYNFLMKSDDLLVSYMTALWLGMGFAVIAMIVIFFIVSIGHGIWRGFMFIRGDGPLISDDNIIKQGVKAVKENYCPMIDWENVKSN